MRSEDEIKDKIIELYKRFIKSFDDQYNGADYRIKKQIDMLEWVIQGNNQ